jgi:hypothetical protein
MKRFSLFFLLVFSAVALPLSIPQDTSLETQNVAVAAPAENTMIYLPLVFNHYDPQFPGQMFGMQVYGSTAENSTYYPYLMNSQASWVRVNTSWLSVEPVDVEPANYSWGSIDQLLSVARSDKGGLNLIAVVDVVPVWARLTGHANGPIASDSLEDFSEYVEALVERYDGDGFEDAPGNPVVRHWEFFNEPDLSSRWGNYGAEYAAMLKVAYPAVKRANSSAQVLFAGIAYDWFESQGGLFVESFLDDVLIDGAGDYFDVMNFHVYPLFEPNWGGDSTGLIGKTTAIRQKLAEYGLEKPVVITEAGWYNNADVIPGSSDAEQIARLVQLITQGLAADVKVLIWWMLWDPGDGISDYGLVTNDSPPVPKQAFTAYQTAVSLLNNTRAAYQLTNAVTGSSNMEAYRMTTTAATVYTAWMNPYGTTEVRPLRIPAASATVLDGLGNTIGTAVDNDNDGYVTVAVSSQPIYIQVTN